MTQQIAHESTLYRPVGRVHPTYSQISLDLLRKFDTLAISPLVPDRAVYHFCKRVVDLSVAFVALILLSPLMAIIAALIVLDSGWPPFFAQERVGGVRWFRAGYSYWRKKTFTFYKFRSMKRDADPNLHKAFIEAFMRDDREGMVRVQQAASGATTVKLSGEPALGSVSGTAGGRNGRCVLKLVDDPRVTRVGQFLRKTSLDELPQLWNVLKGDMSLVGPRPDLPYAVELYEPRHYQRLAAQPGISGLWQVKGRAETSFDDMIRMDIEYVKKSSLVLDLKILLSTVSAVMSRKGAA